MWDGRLSDSLRLSFPSQKLLRFALLRVISSAQSYLKGPCEKPPIILPSPKARNK
jgi:hypothetical protein